jgi:hypothetical protein
MIELESYGEAAIMHKCLPSPDITPNIDYQHLMNRSSCDQPKHLVSYAIPPSSASRKFRGKLVGDASRDDELRRRGEVDIHE